LDASIRGSARRLAAEVFGAGEVGRQILVESEIVGGFELRLCRREFCRRRLEHLAVGIQFLFKRSEPAAGLCKFRFRRSIPQGQFGRALLVVTTLRLFAIGFQLDFAEASGVVAKISAHRKMKITSMSKATNISA